jgi:hypothetical protein
MCHAWHMCQELHTTDVESSIFLNLRRFKSMLGGCLVTTAWRVLRLRMEGSPPGTEVS